jgi:protein-S-isoprenylcysteine O-methyltransferase Ste14
MEFQRIRGENIPVPQAEIAGIFIGLLLQGFIGRFYFPLVSYIFMTGWALFGIGFLLGAWAVLEAGSNKISPPDKLIMNGPYCISRNPMYIGWMGIYLGLGFIFYAPWIIILFPLVFLYNHSIDILQEERQLHAKFGPAYEEYCKRVPRYI